MNNIFYIGGYKNASEYCLHCCEFHSGAMRIVASYEVGDASYLCLSPNGKYLYAVMETELFCGQKGGGVAAFAVEDGGALRFINNAPTEGEHPCHLSVSADGKLLYVANYTGGSCIFYELLETGGIGAKNTLVDNNKFGVPSMAVQSRQAHPHAHFIQPFEIAGVESLWVCDLGLDKLLVIDNCGDEVARLDMPKGFGIRHIAFDPARPIAYVVGELGKAVIAVNYTVDAGVLTLHASEPVSVLQANSVSVSRSQANSVSVSRSQANSVSVSRSQANSENVSCAAIRISPDGKYLLVSNRGSGADSISIFAIDSKQSKRSLLSSGVPELVHIYKTGGRCPRDFAFTPDGKSVIVAYQDSDVVELLAWNDGILTPTGVEMQVQRPTCVVVV